VCKVIAFGFKIYVQDRWNIFDVIIVGTSLVDYGLIIFQSDENEVLKQVFNLVRILRLMRVLKIARFFKGMQAMLHKTT